MENLNNINTVQDLLDANKAAVEDVTSEKLADSVLKEGPAVAMDVACAILHVLKNYHIAATEKYIKDGNADVAAQWASDAARFDIALDSICEIEM
jgi:hypothetical protein